MTARPLRRAAWAGSLATLVVLLAGLGPAACTRRAGGEAAPVIDGRFEDWPPGVLARADDEYLYVRLALPEERTLQAAGEPLVVRIDPAVTLVFSPPESEGQGVAVRAAAGAASAGASLGHAAVDLVVAPTVAAREFELRVAREVAGRPDLTAALAEGTVRVTAAIERGDGSVAWRSPVHELRLPPLSAHATPAPATLPAAAAGELRVVSWNVYLAKPREEPEAFARVLLALRPDVVLLQEWDGATGAELAAWFDAHVPGEPPWQALTSAGWGVAVVARGPWQRLGPERIARPDEAPADPRRGDAALRLAAGVAATPLGRVCAASLHLKCCGAASGAQDAARRAETRLANQVLAAALGEAGDCVRVVGGDLNLVGSDVPLANLRAGLGSDGRALAVAETTVLGDGAVYTWSQRWSRFSPGRLDYLLYDAATVTAVRAFVLDARRLDQPTLAAAALTRADAAASDHLPLVLDLRRGGTLRAAAR